MENRPIRILHVLASMDFGGAETLLMNLYRTLNPAEIQFDFAVCTGSEAAYDAEILERGGMIYHYPRYIGTNHFQYCKWWKSFFQNEGKDYRIVHGHIGSTAAIYLSIAKKFGKYTIAHSHNTNEPLDSSKAILYRVFSYPTRFIADAFIGCSGPALTDRYGKKHIAKSSKPSFILQNGIQTGKFKFDSKIREDMREKLNIAQDCFVVGHVGRCTKAKNPLFMLEIFAEIHKINSNSILLYIGKGELESQVEGQIQKLNLKDSVIRVKETPYVEQYMQAMDLFLFPSIFEGLPVVLVEAQSSGLPVITSNNITKETRITDLVHYFDLKDSPAQWAENTLIVYDSIVKNRIAASETVSKSQFDIAYSARHLYDFYCSHIKS